MAKILFLDDAPRLIQSVKTSLRPFGHEIIGVEKISHAIEELSNDRFDLVVCDGLDGDGADFAEQLQKQFVRGGRATKVMIFSSEEINRREGVYFGLKGGRKPLNEMVSEALAGRVP